MVFTSMKVPNTFRLPIAVLPITAVGTLGHGFNDVFVSSGLSTNLFYVGQLVDTNYDVHFSHGG